MDLISSSARLDNLIQSLNSAPFHPDAGIIEGGKELTASLTTKDERFASPGWNKTHLESPLKSKSLGSCTVHILLSLIFWRLKYVTIPQWNGNQKVQSLESVTGCPSRPIWCFTMPESVCSNSSWWPYT